MTMRFVTAIAGLLQISSGKVREVFEIEGHPDLLAIRVSDRISIFDWILPFEIPGKGVVLNALAAFWMTKLALPCRHHLVAFGEDIRKYIALPDSEDPCRWSIVRRLTMIPVECVVRGYLTGSMWDAYLKALAENPDAEFVVVLGVELPRGMHNGDRLPKPASTPTTKAESGHDMPMDPMEVERLYPGLGALAIQLYILISEYAEKCGFVFADTKFEFGIEVHEDGSYEYILGDEAGTFDSSRFWKDSERLAAIVAGTPPPSYDKEEMRKWGKDVETPVGKGLNNKTLDPENPEHQAFVASIKTPSEVAGRVHDLYFDTAAAILGAPVYEWIAAQQDAA